MPILSYPFTDGSAFSFLSAELRMGPFTFVGVKDVAYDRKRDRKKVWGTNADPLSKTRGKNDYNCSVELYLAEFNALLQEMGPGYGDTPFLTIVNFTENGFDTVTDVIVGCTIDTTKSKNSGDEALTREFDLNPLKILFSGMDDQAIENALIGLPF